MITGKGNTLDFLVDKLPKLPVPEYVRVSAEDARTRVIPALDWDETIVRSDALCEDVVGKSFAGMFNSYVANSIAQVPQLARQVAMGFDREALEKYYTARRKWHVDPDFEPPRNIPVILQKYEPGTVQFYITRHPHDDTLHVEFDFEPPGAEFSEAHPFRVRTAEELLSLVNSYSKRVEDLRLLTTRKAQEQIVSGINHFLQAEELLDPSISYQMEASLLPHSIYQMRPFRNKEYADFSLEDVIPNDDLIDVPVVIGLTPSEGIPFRHIGLKDMYSWDRGYIQDHFMNFIVNANSHQQSGKLIGASFMDDISRGAAIADDPFSRSAYLRFFSGAKLRNNSEWAIKWQTHDTFRLLEREGLFGVSVSSPNKYENCDAHYWSDGKRGAIQMFGKPTTNSYF